MPLGSNPVTDTVENALTLFQTYISNCTRRNLPFIALFPITWDNNGAWHANILTVYIARRGIEPVCYLFEPNEMPTLSNNLVLNKLSYIASSLADSLGATHIWRVNGGQDDYDEGTCACFCVGYIDQVLYSSARPRLAHVTARYRRIGAALTGQRRIQMRFP